MIVQARRAFFAIADAVGDTRIPDYLVDNRSGCHGDCEDVGDSGEFGETRVSLADGSSKATEMF